MSILSLYLFLMENPVSKHNVASDLVLHCFPTTLLRVSGKEWVNANCEKDHGGESRDLNDRVHGISCRYSDKQVNKLITLFLIPNRFSSTFYR